jgi:CHAD domain-containing protein
MAFELKRGRGVGAELRRLFQEQLDAAIENLSGDRPDVHAARRRIKKARAIVHAARPALGRLYLSSNRRLRKARHLLGPLTDADTVVAMLDRLRGFDLALLPEADVARLRAALETDAERVYSVAADARAKAVRLLMKQRDVLGDLDATACGVHSTARALRRAHRTARTARAKALARPTTATFHAWRRRTKLEWHLLRLVNDVVGGRLIDDERRVEQLDACLGELHDLALLQDHVRQRSPLSRSETARALRAIRRFERDVRRRARLQIDALDEPPRELETRVASLWLSWRPRIEPSEGEPWRSLA